METMKINPSIFAPANEPPLFPITVPEIPKPDYDLFYQSDREIFTNLIVALHREAEETMLVMAFFLWLEKEGLAPLNLVEKMCETLPLHLLNRVADEAVLCLKCIKNKANGLSFEGGSIGYDISLLQGLVKKKISLHDLHKDRDSISGEVSYIVENVCKKAFKDILGHFNKRGALKEGVVGSDVGGHRYIGPLTPFHSYDHVNKSGRLYPGLGALGFGGTSPNAQFTAGVSLYNPYPGVGLGGLIGASMIPKFDFLQHGKFDFVQHGELGLNQRQEVPCAPVLVPHEEKKVAPEDRTIFLTFSKGYPISEDEVREYFTRRFGDFIERIDMQEVAEGEQPLYAKIISRSLAMVIAVVENDGPEGKSKYNIDGRHVWARKYVKKSRMAQYAQHGGTSRMSRLQPAATPYFPSPAATATATATNKP